MLSVEQNSGMDNVDSEIALFGLYIEPAWASMKSSDTDPTVRFAE